MLLFFGEKEKEGCWISLIFNPEKDLNVNNKKGGKL